MQNNNNSLSATMSTSNQHQRGGRRQPFGFLNANTISGSTVSGKNSGAGISAAATAAAAHSNPIKNEPKKKLGFGILRSIVTRSKGKRHVEESASATSEHGSAAELLEGGKPGSPTKKTRVMTMEDEDAKPSSADSITDTAVAADDYISAVSDTPSLFRSFEGNQFAASDTASFFRQRPMKMDDGAADFWNDEMEDMLELKRAKPIMDHGEEEEDNTVAPCATRFTYDPSQALMKELTDENTAPDSTPILLSNRVHEDNNGFNIYFDQ